MVGDITVDREGSLKIMAGTEIRFATTDAQQSGLDPSRCELMIYGTLTVTFGSGRNVVFTSAARDPGEGDWYGICLDAKSARLYGFFENDIRLKYSERGVFWSGPGEPGLSLFNYKIYDHVKGLGNGDGAANPGEFVEIEMVLRNWSFRTFHDIEVTMSVEEPFRDLGGSNAFAISEGATLPRSGTNFIPENPSGSPERA